MARATVGDDTVGLAIGTAYRVNNHDIESYDQHLKHDGYKRINN